MVVDDGRSLPPRGVARPLIERCILDSASNLGSATRINTTFLPPPDHFAIGSLVLPSCEASKACAWPESVGTQYAEPPHMPQRCLWRGLGRRMLRRQTRPEGIPYNTVTLFWGPCALSTLQSTRYYQSPQCMSTLYIVSVALQRGARQRTCLLDVAHQMY